MSEETVPAPAEQSGAPAPVVDEQQQNDASTNAEHSAEQGEQQAEKKPGDGGLLKHLRKQVTVRDRELGAERAARQRLEAELAALRQPQQTQEENAPPKVDLGTLREEARRDVEFAYSIETVTAAGKKDFGEAFDESLENLSTIDGRVFNPTLEAILALDKPALVLHHLGQNLDEAEKYFAMSPMKRATTLAKLEVSLAEKSKPAISKAPPPLQAIRGAASVAVDPSKMTDAEWSKWNSEQKRVKRN